MKAGIGVNYGWRPPARQGTYSTNRSRRNAKFRGEKIVGKFNEWEKMALCVIEEHSHSFRCRPEICRLADHFFPGYPSLESRNEGRTHHDGVFLVRPAHVAHYITSHRPTVLRWDRREKCQGFDGINFGESKGQEYERVLVFPTGPIRKWIASGDSSYVQDSVAKLYVAVARGRGRAWDSCTMGRLASATCLLAIGRREACGSSANHRLSPRRRRSRASSSTSSGA